MIVLVVVEQARKLKSLLHRQLLERISVRAFKQAWRELLESLTNLPVFELYYLTAKLDNITVY